MLKKLILILALNVCCVGLVAAQAIITQNTLTPTQLVNNVLIGQGITATNITYNGSPVSAGNTQSSALSFISTGFPFAEGVFLRTQTAPSVSDPDLNAIATNTVTNGAILEFDFVATGDTLNFRYMFASVEYPTYVCSGFNDVFGFFISGPGITGPYTNNAMNIALIPGSNIPVSINTVNSGVAGGAGNPGTCAAQDPNWVENSIYYTTQYGGYSGQGYNGGTVALPAGSTLQCGQTYHIKLAVSNVGDTGLDSGVYLEGGSFTSFPVEFNFTTFTDDNSIYEGCNQVGTLMFTRGGCNDENEPLVAYTSFSGQSQNGVDYQLLGDSVYFAPGVDTIVWSIVPIEDGLVEGIETLEITVTSILLSGDTMVSTGLFFINDVPDITVTGLDVTYNCLQDSTDITATVTGGFAPYQYLWDNGDTTIVTTVPIDGNGVDAYLISIIDACGYTAEDSVYVTMNQTLAIDSMLQFPATACDPTGTVVGFASGITGTPVYNWTGPGQGSPNMTDASVFQNLSPGWYYFTVTDNVCEVNDSIQVTQEMAPIASFTPSETAGCSPLSVNFTNTSQNATSFSWNFGNGQTANVNDMSSQSSVFTTDSYVQLIASEGGCSDTMQILISIANCGCNDPAAINYDPTAELNNGTCQYPIPMVEIPNVFTPDADNANELFFLTTTNATNIEMLIYNRWGNLMYEGSGLNPVPAWDGKNAGGSDAMDGVYFVKYKVSGYNNQALEGHGFLHLIRK